MAESREGEAGVVGDSYLFFRGDKNIISYLILSLSSVRPLERPSQSSRLMGLLTFLL